MRTFTRTNSGVCNPQISIFEGLMPVQNSIFDAKTQSRMSTIKSAMIMQFDTILKIINKISRPDYLGVKWFYIREDYRACSKRPTENAILDLKKVANRAEKNGEPDANLISFYLEAVRELCKLEDYLRYGQDKEYEMKLSELKKCPDASHQRYCASLITLMHRD